MIEAGQDASLLSRTLRFGRSVAVGGVATLADWLTLTGLVELGGVHETVANVPALMVGAAVQFIGCRNLVFQAARGSMRRQLLGFSVVEAATLALNGISFHALVTLTPVPYWLARPLGTFAVFAFFSYPLWKWVFHGSLQDIVKQADG
jgi:putative flippase GtrA